MNAFERKLSRKIGDVTGITPGVIVDVHRKGRRVGLVEVGKTYDFYDLASLTKIIFGATAAIHHFTEYPKELDQPIHEASPWWRHPKTTPRALLTHTAGLEWWLPMYKRLNGPLDPAKRWRQMRKHLARVKPARRKSAIYSDVDLWLFGAFMQDRLQTDMLTLWKSTQDRMQSHDLFFHPANKRKYAQNRYAPTEDCPWRGRVLQGEVHDENTWALGGVAMNAGLFGGIEAVSEWALKLRAARLGDRRHFTDPEVVRYFTARRIPRAQGDWGIGFMKPSPGRSSCGRKFSRRSFGHTGFTGTSVWFDPVKDLLVVILSNRVHPTRENQKFVRFRPRIHDWVCASLD